MSLEQFKILCKKWRNYYIFGREPEEGIKKLLFSINDLHNELLESGTIKKEEHSEEFNDLVLSYVFAWNSNVEKHIDRYINYWINN
jgi:hypothetical protein